MRKLAALEAGKREILATLDRTPALPDFEALTAAVESRVRHFQMAFEESPDHARRALRALLASELADALRAAFDETEPKPLPRRVAL